MNHCYSVSEVTSAIKMLLEARFPQIRIEGEISNYRPSSAGHCYFTLKDQNSMISAVIFRNDASRLPFRPKDGMKVKVTGRITVYPQRGNYQIICSSLEEQGKGTILEILEERKRRLAAEGLFDNKYKKELPPYPEKVVVITSPTGAAIRDIMQVINRRNPSVQIRILPCAVQGENSAAQLIGMIEKANKYNLGDIIIVARGGGSLEDLLSFSDENVVRAISSSYIPVVTGIGHEIDFSLSDFVSDFRAATPSAAAEVICESSTEILKTITMRKREMTQNVLARIMLIREKLKPFSQNEISLHFRRYLEPLILEIDDYRESMKQNMIGILSAKKHRVEILTKELEGHSPYEILKKGYSHVTDASGQSIRNADQVEIGQSLKIRFATGKISAQVEDKNEKE